jgi:hypothetical protein
MSREAPVRFREGLGVKLPRATRLRTPVTVVLVECRRRIKKRKKGRVYWKTRALPFLSARRVEKGLQTSGHLTDLLD